MSVRGSWSLLSVFCVGVVVGGQASGASGLPDKGWSMRRRKEEVHAGVDLFIDTDSDQNSLSWHPFRTLGSMFCSCRKGPWPGPHSAIVHGQ